MYANNIWGKGERNVGNWLARKHTKFVMWTTRIFSAAQFTSSEMFIVNTLPPPPPPVFIAYIYKKNFNANECLHICILISFILRVICVHLNGGVVFPLLFLSVVFILWLCIFVAVRDFGTHSLRKMWCFGILLAAKICDAPFVLDAKSAYFIYYIVRPMFIRTSMCSDSRLHRAISVLHHENAPSHNRPYRW